MELFGAELESVGDYAALLATDGVKRGLLGPREVDRVWHRHIVNCGFVTQRVPRDARVADVGSGAGLPGIVWAIQRPDLHVTLIEPQLRRTRFLDEATRALGLPNVTVLRARCENVASVFDVVTARAVAGMRQLAKLVLPIVRTDGVLLAIKGESAESELADASDVLRTLGATSMIVNMYGDGEAASRVVEVMK